MPVIERNGREARGLDPRMWPVSALTKINKTISVEKRRIGGEKQERWIKTKKIQLMTTKKRES